MHELSLAQGAIDMICHQLADYPGGRVKAVTLTVGEFSAVDPEALRFCFPLAAEGTPVATANLIIETAPLHITCSGCGANNIPARTLRCPRCNGVDIEVVSGRDVLISSIEIDLPDDPADNPRGAHDERSDKE